MADELGSGWYLSDDEYQFLKSESDFLQNLRDAGVDNWEGYHYGWSGFEDDE